MAKFIQRNTMIFFIGVFLLILIFYYFIIPININKDNSPINVNTSKVITIESE